MIYHKIILLLKLFFLFDVLYHQPLLNRSFKESTPDIINGLTFIAIHLSEIFFLIIGVHTIKTEVRHEQINSKKN